MQVLALIPARGGSKSIPKKNIYPLAGKPVIAWTIEAARGAKKIDRIIVSTDSEEIAGVARSFGAETPFIRPAELAGDTTPDLPVFEHALKWLKENENYVPDAVIHLWPTSPYRRSEDIDAAIELLEKNPEATWVRWVSAPSQTPFKMWRRDKGIYLVPILQKEFPEAYEEGKRPFEMPRQVLPEVVVQTGYLCVIRTSTITEGNTMHGDKIIPFWHDPKLYTELDSYKDLAHAEYVLKNFKPL